MVTHNGVPGRVSLSCFLAVEIKEVYTHAFWRSYEIYILPRVSASFLTNFSGVSTHTSLQKWIFVVESTSVYTFENAYVYTKVSMRSQKYMRIYLWLVLLVSVVIISFFKREKTSVYYNIEYFKKAGHWPVMLTHVLHDCSLFRVVDLLLYYMWPIGRISKMMCPITDFTVRLPTK